MPLRGPYNIGDLIIPSKGQVVWPRPCHRNLRPCKPLGCPCRDPNDRCGPATRQEVLAKQLLELRPSRKRRRRDYDDLPAKEALPFSEDLVVPALQGDDDGYVQPGYVEIPTEAGGTELSYLPSVGPPDQEEAETPFQLLPELPSVPESTDAEVEEIPAPTSLEREMSAQPESEASCAPTVPPTPPATPMSSGTLQTALNRSVDQLDGYPRPEIPFLPPPGLERERSRSPARSPAANLQCLMMKEV